MGCWRFGGGGSSFGRRGVVGWTVGLEVVGVVMWKGGRDSLEYGIKEEVGGILEFEGCISCVSVEFQGVS